MRWQLRVSWGRQGGTAWRAAARCWQLWPIKGITSPAPSPPDPCPPPWERPLRWRNTPRGQAPCKTPQHPGGESRARASYERRAQRQARAAAIALGRGRDLPGERGGHFGQLPQGTRVLPSQSQRLGEVLPQPAAVCWGRRCRQQGFSVQKMFPSLQRRIYFRIRNKELELYLSVPDDVEDMKAGRVVVSSLGEQSSSVWYYEDGLIKNQVRAHV